MHETIIYVHKGQAEKIKIYRIGDKRERGRNAKTWVCPLADRWEGRDCWKGKANNSWGREPPHLYLVGKCNRKGKRSGGIVWMMVGNADILWQAGRIETRNIQLWLDYKSIVIILKVKNGPGLERKTKRKIERQNSEPGHIRNNITNFKHKERMM